MREYARRALAGYYSVRLSNGAGKVLNGERFIDVATAITQRLT